MSEEEEKDLGFFKLPKSRDHRKKKKKRFKDNPFTDAERQLMLFLYLSGATTNSIAKTFDTNYTTLTKYIDFEEMKGLVLAKATKGLLKSAIIDGNERDRRFLLERSTHEFSGKDKEDSSSNAQPFNVVVNIKQKEDE